MVAGAGLFLVLAILCTGGRASFRGWGHNLVSLLYDVLLKAVSQGSLSGKGQNETHEFNGTK